MFVHFACVLFCFAGLATVFAADPVATEPAAWPPVIARKLPPPAAALSPADREKAEAALGEIRAALANRAPAPPGGAGVLADVEIFVKAIDYALRHGEFFDPKKDLERVELLRSTALARIAAFFDAKSPRWTERPGATVRGYQSRLDDSYQPYGLVIPEGLDLSQPVPLYVWLHGRGDKQCDLQFIAQFLGAKAPGPLQPANALVLHPFGRYCNGWKNAGEVDVFEAIEDVKKKYQIDPNRIVLAGFSMGGAGAWHLGAHYADRWCAVHAGAGFVDVRRYQALTPDKYPPPVERKLWGLFDVPDYRRNLLNVPVLAYSGEEDKQRAAAEIMVAELKQELHVIPHLIGPKMGHKYDEASLKEIHARLTNWVEQGRNNFPQHVSLQTKTLRYASMHWVEARGLKKHWEDSRIEADAAKPNRITVNTKNITWFDLISPWKEQPDFNAETEFVVDDQTIRVPDLRVHRATLFHKDGKWTGMSGLICPVADWSKSRVKVPGLQGPIDDAFMGSFYVIPPEKADADAPIDRWAQFEMQHFVDRWRMLMRGEPRVEQKYDPQEVQYLFGREGNLVLWGTPQTNPLIAAVLSKLPLTWTETEVALGDLKFDARKVVPMLIFPNPLNTEYGGTYVVINSGLTFREGHDRTNSLQNPKLGDWAFIDVTEPPTDELPGKVLASGFFDEQWQYVPQAK